MILDKLKSINNLTILVNNKLKNNKRKFKNLKEYIYKKSKLNNQINIRDFIFKIMIIINQDS